MISRTTGFVVTQKVGSSYWWQPAYWMFGHKTHWKMAWLIAGQAKFYGLNHSARWRLPRPRSRWMHSFREDICLLSSQLRPAPTLQEEHMSSSVFYIIPSKWGAGLQRNYPKTRPDVERGVHPTLVFSNIPIHTVMSHCWVKPKQSCTQTPSFHSLMQAGSPPRLHAATYNPRGRKDCFCSLSTSPFPEGWNLRDHLPQEEQQSGPESGCWLHG